MLLLVSVVLQGVGIMISTPDPGNVKSRFMLRDVIVKLVPKEPTAESRLQ